jgi:hypothetical protein
MNMAGVAVFDDCPVSRGENEGLRPCGGDEEAVGRIGVSLPGQECALRGRLRVERQPLRPSIGHATGMRNDNFSTFSDFIAQLASDLASGNTTVIAVTASGRFDASSGTFTASNVAVLLTN